MMALPKSTIFLLLCALFLFPTNPSTVSSKRLLPDPIHRLTGNGSADETELKTYIIHIRPPENVTALLDQSLTSLHSSLLSASVPIDTIGLGASRLLHSYNTVMSGFAARLTANELKAISKEDWFVHAYPERVYRPLTTRTPQFLGLNRGKGLWNASNLGEGIIIGLVDTGIYPNHPSFSDEGMPPPPPKWKGRCDFEPAYCNNKLIGARSFTKSNFGSASNGEPPKDESGHGTHTSSTAAGNFVEHASVLGNAEGTAAGMAPRAHIAMYKACGDTCQGADIIAAIEAAVSDGVDIISLSLGDATDVNYADSEPAVAGFAAISKGIFVSCAGGNDGPEPGMTSNMAPWLLTVAASTIDRTISATVKLGNGIELDGQSLSLPKNIDSHPLPLFDPRTTAHPNATFCYTGSLDAVDIRGKIVLCERQPKSISFPPTKMANVVKKAGGAAMILLNNDFDPYTTRAYPYTLPVVHMTYPDAIKIKSYVNSSSTPSASLVFKGTVIGDGAQEAPAISYYSSRGPNRASPGILKPDIAGPGTGILAAWPFPPFFAFEDGTSMAVPHLSGIAALIKKTHPDWSPAAIKSAMMTTADTSNHDGRRIVDEKNLPAGVFAMGAGHVNPSKAVDPGLIYDIAPNDYIGYLCGLGYSDRMIWTISNDYSVECSEVESVAEGELNYPSITVIAPEVSRDAVLRRTVTNVGRVGERYRAVVEAPEGVAVRVEPEELRFEEVGEKRMFSVVVRRTGGGADGLKTAEGGLKWVSSEHVVRSPISVVFEEPERIPL